MLKLMNNGQSKVCILHRSLKYSLSSLLLVTLFFIVTACSNDSVEVITLENNKVKLEVTPDIGGRVLSFSLRDHKNFLKTGEPVQTVPHPKVDAEANNIPYLGHINWVGPQTSWWIQQDINPARLKEKALWPPDPYLIFARNRVVERSPNRLVMEGADSPVSGVRLKKSFSLPDNDRAEVRLDVTATNIRSKNVSWDLWFNTRVYSTTRVYVPVAREADVRNNSFTDNEATGPLEFSLIDGLLTFEYNPPPPGTDKREGKLHIQPSHGWLAGFSNGQALVITFPLQPGETIHPDQGQVELYLKYQPGNTPEELIEMQVHSPYTTLEPGQSMSASEEWTILPYEGPDERSAHTAFLRSYFSGKDG